MRSGLRLADGEGGLDNDDADDDDADDDDDDGDDDDGDDDYDKSMTTGQPR